MRSVLTKEDLEKLEGDIETAPSAKADDRLSQMGKFIPAEVLGFILGAFALLGAADEVVPVVSISWILFAAGFIATIGYTYRSAIKDKVPGKIAKTILTTIAYLIWIFNIEGFSANIAGYNSLYGGIALLGWTSFAPDIYKLIPS